MTGHAALPACWTFGHAGDSGVEETSLRESGQNGRVESSEKGSDLCKVQPCYFIIRQSI